MKIQNFVFLTLALGLYANAAEFSPEELNKTLTPFVGKYCISCHSGPTPDGDTRLDHLNEGTAFTPESKLWKQMAKKIRSGQMPPPTETKLPTKAETEQILKWMDQFRPVEDLQASANSPRVISRLNGAEYDNTIRDLFGINLTVADDFPSDPVDEGYDNNARALILTPILFERYRKAAKRISRFVIANPAAHAKLFVCKIENPNERACAQRILVQIASRAFRRPVEAADTEPLLKIYDLGEVEGPDKGIQLALEAMLLSPNFLYRIEKDTDGNLHPVDQFELASRLSYFLWSSMPDEPLFALAKSGTLLNHLDEQVLRMVRDPKVQGLTANFAGQWLQIRPLKALTPFREVFRPFSDELRESMFKETYLYFHKLLESGGSALELIDSDYTYVNERLARIYGIKGVKFNGEKFRKVKVADGKRGGVITQASVLTATSNPTSTSPVKRGQWVLTSILCDPPDDPPPGAPPIEREIDGEGKILSARKQLEVHRKAKACAGCHSKMDPLGFGLENYNGIGVWRDEDEDFPVDSKGELGGVAFTTPKELKAMLVGKSDQFLKCLTKNLLTYALARGYQDSDAALVSNIVEGAKPSNYALSQLVLGVVKSDAFKMRKRNDWSEP